MDMYKNTYSERRDFVTDINQLITSIRQDIFEYNLEKFEEKIGMLVSSVQSGLSSIQHSQIHVVNEILEYVLIGLQNNDYLLVSDLLYYELRPIIQSNVQEGSIE